MINYQNNTYISEQIYHKMLSIINRETLKGKRDHTILSLLWDDNVLRTGEIQKLTIKDFDFEQKSLLIIPKGKLEKQAINLAKLTIESIIDWLKARKELDLKG